MLWVMCVIPIKMLIEKYSNLKKCKFILFLLTTLMINKPLVALLTPHYMYKSPSHHIQTHLLLQVGMNRSQYPQGVHRAVLKGRKGYRSRPLHEEPHFMYDLGDKDRIEGIQQ